ncbi:probable 2-oxoglutarate dehydrogenase E1 component DHKTD1 homolog, mitochondrial [Chelonus insularis]|uniref:probable 2-oxoglutarate dehydrogenase E1 component DHKTD1 homolog, mitochondrial n=1 Tax=Chelonus insularis TaxID=460826 RepID=UPI00158C04E9|nr:probable 2-oxoglutarate dehydrogenase E1 component DHKTD1 homolog, mitochondrial [Chelonus insularis]
MKEFFVKIIKLAMNRNLISFCIQKKLSKFKQISNRNYYTQDGIYGCKLKKAHYYDALQDVLENRNKFSNFYRLVTAYREHAHKQANIDPVALSSPSKLIELDPQRYGLDLKDIIEFKGLLNTSKTKGTVEEALDILNNVYCKFIGAEFTYLETQEEREWFAEQLENANNNTVDDKTQKSVLKEMLKSQVFDEFLAVKFVTIKRYSGAGAESMIAFLYEFFQKCAEHNLENVVMCMPHRGRLAVLTGLLKFPPEKLFRKYRGLPEFPEDVKAIGDIPSHFVASEDLEFNGKKVHVTMIPNPSHLEAVNPISMGKTRAVMQTIQEGGYSKDQKSYWSDKVINLQIHGDAAYAGQGVNQECSALSAVPHFTIGGSIHFIVNNQLGFTTPASWGRSSRYCTDLAKSISAPVLHVNGDEPEEVIKATRIAFEYQRKFRKDVFVDMNCFRRWGHNEMDEPSLTNPLMYKIINDRRSVPDRYREKLESRYIVNKQENEQIISEYHASLINALKQVDNYIPQPSYFTHQWEGFQQAQSTLTTWDTGVDLSLLHYIINKSVTLKDNSKIHPSLLKSHVQARLNKLESGEHLDWATAETAAFGSLLYQGYNVRVSGQDVGRGTFSHRHAMIVDQSTGEIHIPLNSMAEGQTGQIELANSILSEEAVLGYEYGFSIATPSTLTIWEAQFGDFFNGAQVVIDTFVTGGETKWMLCSGLTILLPHGYDGAGPEHSSCRIERFLQLTDSKEDAPDGDNVNIQVVNPTTPAQYFHVLRRQMVRNFRKPLVIVAPKILLRHKSATSSLTEMAPGTCFKNVIGDDKVDESKVERVILVSGKHYYELIKQREIIGSQNTAIVRVESLCPFPLMELNDELNKYRYARQFIWSQEEPQNMGGWSFIKPRFENLCGKRLKYCGREALATPAVGVGQIHDREALEVSVKPFIIK